MPRQNTKSKAVSKKKTKAKSKPVQNRNITKYDRECAARLKAIYEIAKSERGMTYKRLADKCKWSTATIGFYMNADIALNYKAIKLLAKHLNCSMVDISPKLANDDPSISENTKKLYERLENLPDEDKLLALRFLEKMFD